MALGIQPSSEELRQRFDDLPINRTIVAIIIVLGLAWLSQSYDIGVVGEIVLLVRAPWHLTSSQIGIIGVSSNIGVVIGLLVTGRICDRFGRKPTLIVGLTIFTVFTVLSALASNFGILFLFRVLAGLGEGATFTIPYLLIAEIVNKRRRATAVGYLGLILTAGYVLPSLAAYWATQSFASTTAWRIPPVLGGAFILLIPAIVWIVPESPRYLLDNGRVTEARQLLERFENRIVFQRISHTLPTEWTPKLSEPLTQPVQGSQIQHVIDHAVLENRVNHLFAWCALLASFIIFYIILVYEPDILHKLGATKAQSLLYTAIITIVAAFGTLAVGLLADRFGRRATYAFIILLGATGVMIVALITGLGLIVGAFCVAAFASFGSFTITKTYYAEVFPTSRRASGVMYGEGAARLVSGVILVYYTATLLSNIGLRTYLVIIAALTLVLSIPLVVANKETTGLSLEDISERAAVGNNS